MAKDKLHTSLHGHVENVTKLTRKAQLESYDGCAKLRPVWDDIASKYDAVFTPSVVDEAPVGIERTGDAVSFLSSYPLLLVPLHGLGLITKSPSVQCGQFFNVQLLTSLGLRVRMGYRLG